MKRIIFLIVGITFSWLSANAQTEEVQIRFSTSSLWKVSTTYEDSWMQASFDDSNWEDAVFQGSQTASPEHITSLINPTSTELYFRYLLVNLQYEMPANIKVVMRANDDFSFYFRGEEIGTENSGLAGPIVCYDITDKFVMDNNNLLAVKVDNLAGSTGDLFCQIIVTYEEEIVTATKSLPVTKSSNVVISPNPASDIVNIQFVEFKGDSYFVNIYDLSGKLIFKRLQNSKSSSVDLSGYSKQTYILNLTNELGELIHSEKIIRQ